MTTSTEELAANNPYTMRVSREDSSSANNIWVWKGATFAWSGLFALSWIINGNGSGSGMRGTATPRVVASSALLKDKDDTVPVVANKNDDALQNKFVTSATKCSTLLSAETIKEFSRSQSNEDETLLRWFSTLCGGTYIELGALNGERFSNSYLFHFGLGWSGVLIELVESNYQELIKRRPNELATIHAGVCNEPQTLHYYAENSSVGAIGGIYEFSTPQFREKWWKDVSLDDPRVKKLECDTMDALLKKNTNTRFFDFMSLDVEGAELAVLESIDFERVGFGIVFAEADRSNELKNMAMRELMESKGYSYLFETPSPRSYWWANKDFNSIYKEVLY